MPELLNPDSLALSRAESPIRLVPDYPTPGILFQDVMPVLADAEALRAVTEELLRPFNGQFDVVAGVESRGFLLAGVAASIAGTGVLPIRKAGKLPRPAARVGYSLEYATAAIEVQDDIPAGARVLILDDVLATGGTLAASERIVREIGCDVTGVGVLLEIADLGGRRQVSTQLHSVFQA